MRDSDTGISHAYPVEEVPATPDYVLSLLDAAFRSWTERRLVLYKPASLTLDMTVAAWLKQFPLISRLGLYMEGAECLNELLGLDLPDDAWERFLLKGDQFTLDDLCRFAADHMKTRQAIRPWRPMTGECRPAGAFLTLKSLLAESGADVSEFAPSTPLSDPRFGKRVSGVLLRLIRLAPETFPAGLTFDCPRGGINVVIAVFVLLGFGLFLTGFLGAAFLGFWKQLVPVLCGSGFASVILAMVLTLRLPTWLVIPGMQTYGDLAYALSGLPPRLRKPSSIPGV